MADAVNVCTARTGLAKRWTAGFNMTCGAALGGHAKAAAAARAGIGPAEVGWPSIFRNQGTRRA